MGNRESQEDSFANETIDFINDAGAQQAQLLVVADGMGGHSSGEIASQLAVTSFVDSAKSRELWSGAGLSSALLDANTRIEQETTHDSSLQGMGTTLLAVLRRGDKLKWISVGDSLLLLFRDSELLRLNEDHSTLPLLIEAAEARGESREQAFRDPRRHRLRSALTGKTPTLIDSAECELRRDDILIVASDGIETLSMNDIRSLLAKNDDKDVRDIADLIIRNIVEREALQQDNVTIILYKHG